MRASKSTALLRKSVLRVVFDDEVRFHLHRIGHIAQSRGADELRNHLGMVDLKVIRNVALGQGDGFQTSAICLDFWRTSTTSPSFTR
jgi:hypothetical protein